MMIKRLLIFLAAGFAGCAATIETIPFTAIGTGKPLLGMDNTAAKVYAIHRAQQRALKKAVKNLKHLGHINEANREAVERCVAMYADDQSIEPNEMPDGALEIRLKIDQAALDAIMKCAK